MQGEKILGVNIYVLCKMLRLLGMEKMAAGKKIKTEGAGENGKRGNTK